MSSDRWAWWPQRRLMKRGVQGVGLFAVRAPRFLAGAASRLPAYTVDVQSATSWERPQRAAPRASGLSVRRGAGGRRGRLDEPEDSRHLQHASRAHRRRRRSRPGPASRRTATATSASQTSSTRRSLNEEGLLEPRHDHVGGGAGGLGPHRQESSSGGIGPASGGRLIEGKQHVQPVPVSRRSGRGRGRPHARGACRRPLWRRAEEPSRRR